MRLGWLVAAACAAMIPLAGLSGASPRPTPPVPAGSGSGLSQYAADLKTDPEGFAAYVPQSSCDPQWRRGIRKFRDLVMSTYPVTRDWGSMRDCTDDGVSEHLDGRAWDWNADVNKPKQFAAATDLINWLMAEGPDGEDAYWARRLGIMYIGYNGRLWGSYRAGEGWRKLQNSNPHTDHVHFSFSWAGAFGRTSFWDGTAAAPDFGPCRPYSGEPAALYNRKVKNRAACPTPAVLTKSSATGGVRLWRGSEGAEVLKVQTSLGVSGANGYFGPGTMRAVARYQQGKGLTPTGAVDTLTRRKLVEDAVLKR